MRFILLLATLSLCGCMTDSLAQAAPTPDTCGAAALQSFVGKPKEKLPVNLPKSSRVMCDTCAGTMDYNPARLNVIYNTDTGMVTKVSCG